MREEQDFGGALPSSIFAADFSPGGRTLITASLGGTLAEWDGETGQRRRVLLDPEGLEDEKPRVAGIEDGREVEAPFRLERLSERMRGSSLLSVGFSPDGAAFAVGAANGEAVLWNALSGGESFGWRAHDRDVVALDISPDRRWAATGALEEGGTTFRVWSLREGPVDIREVLSDGRHVGGVWAVCFSPDSRLVAAGGWTLSGYTAPQLYEVESGRHVGWLHWDMTRAMRFSPDGERLLTGDEFGNVKLWKLTEHHPTHEHKAHGDIVHTVGFSPDGKFYFSGSRDGGVNVRETDTGRLVREYPIEGRVLACRFSADGGFLLAASTAEGAGRPVIQRLA